MAGIKLIGTGRYLPQRTVSNEDFTRFLDTSDEWITTRTGIRQRQISNGEPTWYMGLKAAERAIEDAGIDPQEIDMLISTSVTPDYAFPAQSNLLLERLGIRDAFGIDIQCACTGFVFGVDMARRYLATQEDVNTVLIVSAENITKFADYADRSTCVLFGDAAGAAVVQRGEKPAYSFFETQGEGAELMYAHLVPPGNPFADPEQVERYAELFPKGEGHYMYMNGNEVYKYATRALPDAVERVCAKAGIAPEEIDLIVPHQANLRILQTAAKNLGLPMEKFSINIDRYGNTSSACIPVTLSELRESGRLQEGDRMLLAGFGAGLITGAVLFEVER